MFLRKCTKTYKVADSDVYIEKGLSVLIPAYGLHRDPEYFPQPELFNPERFSEENKSKIWDYTYIPFGDGPRACIGVYIYLKGTLTNLLILTFFMQSQFNLNYICFFLFKVY